MLRQVPKKYAIIGGGKVARHMAHYFTLERIKYNVWCRDSSSTFNTYQIQDNDLRLRYCLDDADCVLLLINDDAIEPFVENNVDIKEYPVIHFSGSLQLSGVGCCHPLMTFGERLYDQNIYREIPFVTDQQGIFDQYFPMLENPSVFLKPELRIYYHSLCVMAGNFTHVLWKEVGSQFEQLLDIDSSLLFPYLKKVLENFILDPNAEVTGPIQRKDKGTIDKHLATLKKQPLGNIYKAFCDYLGVETNNSNQMEGDML